MFPRWKNMWLEFNIQYKCISANSWILCKGKFKLPLIITGMQVKVPSHIYFQLSCIPAVDSTICPYARSLLEARHLPGQWCVCPMQDYNVCARPVMSCL